MEDTNFTQSIERRSLLGLHILRPQLPIPREQLSQGARAKRYPCDAKLLPWAQALDQISEPTLTKKQSELTAPNKIPKCSVIMYIFFLSF